MTIFRPERFVLDQETAASLAHDDSFPNHLARVRALSLKTQCRAIEECFSKYMIHDNQIVQGTALSDKVYQTVVSVESHSGT